MKLSGWGRYPVIDSTELPWSDTHDLYGHITSSIPYITFGNGRSYGDSALAARHLPTRRLNKMLAFNPETGMLTCESGVLLSEVIQTFVPKGWFLKVTPGTRLITVGGAIASDVHGKNHHIAGCFSECIDSFTLMLPDGNVMRCSKNENVEWFKATCGGMGLTGTILTVSFYLKKIQSQWIKQTTIKTSDLRSSFEAFEENANQPYSVAWIDCLAKKEHLGRSILMVGDFDNDEDLHYQPAKKHTIPFDFPDIALNKLSVKAFNTFYYHRITQPVSHQKVSIDSFFYPLDAMLQWNKIYGKNGFTQFQFILPKHTSFDGLSQILGKISDAGMGSFLAVLKLYGPENNNYLSFPMEGYSLALDFKIEFGLSKLLDTLSHIVADFGGRIYLAKDAFMTREVFDIGYPAATAFRQFRQEHGLNNYYQSLQSQRLGL